MLLTSGEGVLTEGVPCGNGVCVSIEGKVQLIRTLVLADAKTKLIVRVEDGSTTYDFFDYGVPNEIKPPR